MSSDHPAPARGQQRCPQRKAVDSRLPLVGGTAVAHRLPAIFTFGLTRRCAACPNEKYGCPAHQPIYFIAPQPIDSHVRLASPFRLIPDLEKTQVASIRKSWPRWKGQSAATTSSSSSPKRSSLRAPMPG